MKTIYSFESSDSLAQFSAWLWHIHLTPLAIWLAFDATGWKSLLAGLLICVVHVVGLRASITVKEAGAVTIVKKWFFIPYRIYRAARITDVSYGGDWGLEEGAVGVVVELGGKEVHIGTSKNMRTLHAQLMRAS